MYNSAPTGFSAPGSAEASSMDTSSSSSRNIVESPSKYQRSAPVSAAAATTATMRMVAEHEAPITIRSSTSSDGTTVISSAERNRRTAVSRAKRETARRHLALAIADEQVAEAELDEARVASAPGSIARLEDVASNSGESFRAARPKSSAELAIPQLMLGSLQEHQQPAPRQQDGERSPAHAESGGQGTTNILIQQTINNDGCVLGPLNVNMHQEVYHAVEQVAQLAEERHKAAVRQLTATAEEHHRS